MKSPESNFFFWGYNTHNFKIFSDLFDVVIIWNIGTKEQNLNQHELYTLTNQFTRPLYTFTGTKTSSNPT